MSINALAQCLGTVRWHSDGTVRGTEPKIDPGVASGPSSGLFHSRALVERHSLKNGLACGAEYLDSIFPILGRNGGNSLPYNTTLTPWPKPWDLGSYCKKKLQTPDLAVGTVPTARSGVCAFFLEGIVANSL